MKKYFSLTMLLAMVLTFVSAMPAQAALDATYPYIFLDYNQQVASRGSGSGWTTATAIWADGQGVDGTGALKIEDRNHNSNDTLGTMNLLDKESITRDTYTISGWVKVIHADKYDADGNKIDENGDGKTDQWEFIDDLRLGTILYYGYNNNGSAGTEYATNFSAIPVSGLSDGKWHYFTQTYAQGTFTGMTGKSYDWTTSKPSQFQFRFLTHSGTDQRFFQVFKGFNRYLPGTTTDTDQRGELLYYIDDYQYTPVVADTIVDGSVPVVTLTSPDSLASNVVGDTVNVSWSHTPSNSAVSSKVVIRVFKKVLAGSEYATEGWALVDQQFAEGNSYSYPLTAEMLGDTYKFEVFPYDVTSNSYRPGAIKTVTMTRPVSNPVTVKPKAGTPITFASLGAGNGGTITFELAEVTNNRSTTTLDLFTIIALYDSNGALVDCKIKNLPDIVGVGSLTAEFLTHTVTLSTDAEYNEVASAKAFVWSGSNFDDTASHISYTSVQSKTK